MTPVMYVVASDEQLRQEIIFSLEALIGAERMGVVSFGEMNCEPAEHHKKQRGGFWSADVVIVGSSFIVYSKSSEPDTVPELIQRFKEIAWLTPIVLTAFQGRALNTTFLRNLEDKEKKIIFIPLDSDFALRVWQLIH